VKRSVGRNFSAVVEYVPKDLSFAIAIYTDRKKTLLQQRLND